MNIDKITNFLFEIASMRRLIRSHVQVIPEANDNISDHSFRVAVIGALLSKMENCDVYKALIMCLFHDVAETRIGDANSTYQRYTTLHEKDARDDQFSGIPLGDEILELLNEFDTCKSMEAIVAKDADALDQMILQREYLRKDLENHDQWQNYSEKCLKTESAKKIAQKIRRANPFEWYYEVAKQRNKRLKK